MSPEALNHGPPLPVPAISEWNCGTLYLSVPLYWHICRSLKITTLLVFVHVLNSQETDESKIRGTWSNVWQEWVNEQTFMPVIYSAKYRVWCPNFILLDNLIDSANLPATLTSSFSWAKNRGKRCSMVLSLPRMGDRPIMTEASADLTCWLASDTSSFRRERRR